MSAVPVSPIRTQTMASVLRPTRGASAASFPELLASLRETASRIQTPVSPADFQAILAQPSGSIVVHPGDCLSRICAEQLKEQGGSVSQRQLYVAVKDVAKANHLTNPDKLYVGQKLDLSVLATFPATGAAADTLASPDSTQPWKALAKGAVALSSNFGLRADPFTGQLHQHNGIDVAAPAGASIQAFAAGSVIFSGWKPGYGNTVIIRHEDGLETLYGHASKLLVQVGDQVASQMPIGAVGSTGRSTGAHLHFEVRRNGTALNPLGLLNAAALQVAHRDAQPLLAQL